MQKIDDTRLRDFYYKKYNMDQLFDESLVNELEVMKFNRLEYLCREEEPMNYLMFFVEGKAKVFRTLANGKNLLISFYAPFEVMGEVELLEERSTSCTAQALSTCYVLALDMSKARAKLSEDVSFLKFTCNILAEKLHNLGTNSSINLFYPLENRLASYILITSVRVKDKEGQEQLVFLENLTHLSELLGTSYRHLLRTLNSLCKNNIITKDKKGYIIKDLVGLEDLAEDLF